LRSKFSFYSTVTLILILSILTGGCSSTSVDEIDDGDVAVSFNINDPKIKDLLGTDDGYAFAIFYGSDIDGSLETCG
jgi:hypothetical protein